MVLYELNNYQRSYFGLLPVLEHWERVVLSDTITVYYDSDKIVKVLNYYYGYIEYDTDIDTRQRSILQPKTSRGKEQNFTVARLLKIKGSGVQFSGSFHGGGITVYDNKRNVFFIKGFAEEGDIQTYADIDNWIDSYINKASSDHFEWLDKQLNTKRLNIKVQPGDFIAFKIGQSTYGFARILLDVFKERRQNRLTSPLLSWVHPRSLVVAPYAFYADTKDVDTNQLALKKTLPALFIFDIEVYRGEMPIVGHKALSDQEKKTPLPKERSTYLTIPYSKMDIETFIATNGTTFS